MTIQIYLVDTRCFNSIFSIWEGYSCCKSQTWSVTVQCLFSPVLIDSANISSHWQWLLVADTRATAQTLMKQSPNFGMGENTANKVLDLGKSLFGADSNACLFGQFPFHSVHVRYLILCELFYICYWYWAKYFCTVFLDFCVLYFYCPNFSLFV